METLCKEAGSWSSPERPLEIRVSRPVSGSEGSKESEEVVQGRRLGAVPFPV